MEIIDYLNIPYGPLMEEWRDVVDFENIYSVSNYGVLKSKARLVTANYTYPSGKQSIKSIPRKEVIRNLKTGNRGYWDLHLSEDNRKLGTTLHRVMCMAFIPNPQNKEFVNHKNSIRDDKFISNFEWSTPKENIQHAVKYSAAFNNRSQLYKLKFSESDFYEIKDLLKMKISQKFIAKKYNISTQTVSLINVGRSYYEKKLLKNTDAA